MPKHTGRRRKKGGIGISTSPYEMDHFRTLLTQIGGDPSGWELKNQWREFYRRYFDVTNVRDECVKTAYLFYKKHKQTLSVCNPVTSSQNIPAEPTSQSAFPDSSQISSSSYDNLSPFLSPSIPPASRTRSNFPSPNSPNNSAMQFPNLKSISNSVVLINCGQVAPINLDTNRPNNKSLLTTPLTYTPVL